MYNLRRWRFLVVAAGCLVWCSCHSDSPRQVPQTIEPTIEPEPSQAFQYQNYNLVFVSFDALQAAHVSSLGNPRKVTPTLDALAKHGFSFSRAYSVASWTVPASMTWFTGVYPSEHRMTNKFALYQPPRKKLANLKELAPNILTLAEIMKQNGYATGGFTGNAGVSGGFGYEQGFDVYFYEQGRFGSLDQSIPQALNWLRAIQGKKFFLFLHGYDCHGQNTPAQGFDYRYVESGYDGKYTGSAQEQELLREEGLERGQVTLRDQDVAFWKAIYDEKIQRADQKFQAFLGEFDKLGLTDKTLFIITSDHGTEFYEHRRFDHGFTLYDEQIHVPLILKLPLQAKGRIIPERVSSIDVLPTILDLLQLRVAENVKQQLRGTSLVPALRGSAAPRDLFAETDYRQYTYKRAIITPEGWKLIYTLESQERELYDLEHDPGEAKNLCHVHPDRVDFLEKKLFDHFQYIGHDLRSRQWERGLNPVYSSQGK